MGRRLHFVDGVEETKKLNRPITRSVAKRLLVPSLHTEFVEPLAHEMDEHQM
jgi:hypothetical protein